MLPLLLLLILILILLILLREWEGGDVGTETVAICDALAAQGKRCGVMCRSEEDIKDRAAQGFRVLSLGQDISLLIRSMTASLAMIRPAPESSTAMAPQSGGQGVRSKDFFVSRL